MIPQDWKRVAENSGIVGFSAAATYFLQYLSTVNFGEWTPVVTALIAVLSTAIKQWLSTSTYVSKG